MYCIIYIKTGKNIDDFRRTISAHFGNSNSVEAIYNQTTLKKATQDFLPLYFYGNTNQVVNFLFARESANRLRIFIEGVNKRDNLDQLVTAVIQVFNNVKSFLDDNKINYSDVSATIWSEDEEMLKGEYQGYWVKFFSFLPDIQTSIYLTVFTIIYSVIHPNADSVGKTNLEDVIKTAGINLLIVALAVLVWLLVKAYNKKTNLSFKIK